MIIREKCMCHCRRNLASKNRINTIISVSQCSCASFALAITLFCLTMMLRCPFDTRKLFTSSATNSSDRSWDSRMMLLVPEVTNSLRRTSSHCAHSSLFGGCLSVPVALQILALMISLIFAIPLARALLRKLHCTSCPTRTPNGMLSLKLATQPCQLQSINSSRLSRRQKCESKVRS